MRKLVAVAVVPMLWACVVGLACGVSFALSLIANAGPTGARVAWAPFAFATSFEKPRSR